VLFEDLFDIEKRPGAGVGLWTQAVERQLERVRDANHRHRLHHSPNEDEQKDDPDAEWQLHADVYFLALAIRRVLLFHDLLAKQTQDKRLAEARRQFARRAPDAKTLRDFYEHLDEYLLDHPRKHRKEIPGRAAPRLLLRWAADDVVVAFGPLHVDVTVAAVAAIELGKSSAAVWEECMDQSKKAQPQNGLAADEHEPGSAFELTLGVSTVIGGEDEGHQKFTGVLLDAGVRPPPRTDA
jgi:hypothetical protein